MKTNFPAHTRVVSEAQASPPKRQRSNSPTTQENYKQFLFIFKDLHTIKYILKQ